MPALGEPASDRPWQEKLTAHGVLAPLSYCPAPGRKASAAVVPGQHPRPSGRRAAETRPCHLRTAMVPNASGSAYVEQGSTKIVAAVYGPRDADRRDQVTASATEGLLYVDLSFSPFALMGVSKDENEKRAVLYSSILQTSLESVTALERYKGNIINVHLLVLEDDGSVLTAALTAASLALADASIETQDLAAGASIHLAANGAESCMMLLDCDSAEERSMPSGSAVMHLGFCPSSGALCMLHSSGPLPPTSFEQMVLLGKDTAEVLGREMKSCIEQRAAKRQRLLEGPA